MYKSKISELERNKFTLLGLKEKQTISRKLEAALQFLKSRWKIGEIVNGAAERTRTSDLGITNFNVQTLDCVGYGRLAHAKAIQVLIYF